MNYIVYQQDKDGNRLPLISLSGEPFQIYDNIDDAKIFAESLDSLSTVIHRHKGITTHIATILVIESQEVFPTNK